MATALFSIGSELCDDLERLAPLTRVPRGRGLDLTAATLAVRAERLRARVSVALGARDDHAVRADSIATDVEEITELVRAWRVTHTQAHPVAHEGRREDALTAVSVALERSALLLRLLRRTSPPSATDATPAPLEDAALDVVAARLTLPR